MLTSTTSESLRKESNLSKSSLTSDWHSDHSRMSSQAGFVTTKNRNLSAKVLKRLFKDGVVPKKLPKRQRVAKVEPIEAPEGK
jgi:hypothetical protein